MKVHRVRVDVRGKFIVGKGPLELMNDGQRVRCPCMNGTVSSRTRCHSVCRVHSGKFGVIHLKRCPRTATTLSTYSRLKLLTVRPVPK